MEIKKNFLPKKNSHFVISRFRTFSVIVMALLTWGPSVLSNNLNQLQLLHKITALEPLLV